MTIDEIMDQEVYGSKVKQTLTIETDDFNWRIGYTSLDEFEGMYLSMTDEDRIICDVMASTIIRRQAE
jgi:hypothetical protein